MRGRGMCMAGVAYVTGGGGCGRGVCMAGGHIGGHAWWGVCMAGGMHGRGVRVAGGMHGRRCVWWVGMRGGGVCMADTTTYGDTVNERAVHILLECILVLHNFILNVFVLVFLFVFFNCKY